jgi:hypothetical protein
MIASFYWLLIFIPYFPYFAKQSMRSFVQLISVKSFSLKGVWFVELLKKCQQLQCPLIYGNLSYDFYFKPIFGKLQ